MFSGMNVLLGIGNIHRGDDGVGPYVARRVHMSGWKAIDCGTSPENFTSVVREARPELLVLVDAALMGCSAGEFRVVPPERIEGVATSTHRLPFSLLISYLSHVVERIHFIGIEPLSIKDGGGLSSEVREGAHSLLKLLERGEIGRIPALE
ncbi:MAG: hydrogenase 3 maturation endopeptidase HyCI [Methanomicrobiales archaeon]|nr:hydrogenase 3 maturation endopeptidase HyCI [Methanomicrobiales archaeon]